MHTLDSNAPKVALRKRGRPTRKGEGDEALSMYVVILLKEVLGPWG